MVHIAERANKMQERGRTIRPHERVVQIQVTQRQVSEYQGRECPTDWAMPLAPDIGPVPLNCQPTLANRHNDCILLNGIFRIRAKTMAYEYEIFISYRKVFPIKEWIYEHLTPFIGPYLESELNMKVRIFIDGSQVEQGDIWPARIRRALVYSKCLVAIWSPNYFQSQWCMNEYNVMRNREKRLGYGTTENPTGLILPLKVFDGQHFPQDALDVECLDCRDYLRIGEGYRYTPRYVEFQDSLLKWATSAARAIRHAPEWSEEWLKKEWLDDVIGEIHRPGPMIFECPRME